MGDVASPQYPTAQPAQNSNMLSGGPAQVIGVINALNQQKMFNATFDAQSQIPAANLQSIRQQQQIQAHQTFGAALANEVRGLGRDAKKDDVINATVNLSRRFPDIAATYPDAISAAKDTILNTRSGDIQAGANTLLNSTLSPGEASSRVDVTDPGTGKKYSIPTTSANMSGTIQTGLPQGSEESSRVMQGDLAREGSYATDVVPMKSALKILDEHGAGFTGPGSEGRQAAKEFFYTLAPSLVPKSEQKNITDYAKLRKYLVNNASQRAQNLGPHTNEGLATSVSGSPNVSINDLSDRDLLRVQLALRNMEHTQVLQASKAGGPSYTTAKAAFSAQHDPRAYAINTMSPDEIQNLKKTLKGPERARFNQSLKAAIDSGVVDQQ